MDMMMVLKKLCACTSPSIVASKACCEKHLTLLSAGSWLWEVQQCPDPGGHSLLHIHGASKLTKYPCRVSQIQNQKLTIYSRHVISGSRCSSCAHHVGVHLQFGRLQRTLLTDGSLPPTAFDVHYLKGL